MIRPRTLRSIPLVLAMTASLTLQPVDRVDAQIQVDAVVQFGPAHPQPAPPGHHVLLPEEVTILKGGTVTFQVNGGGHGVAIYPVSKHTTRDDIEADLCPGGPGAPDCVGATGDGPFLITDERGDVIVNIAAFQGVPFFDYLPARVLGAIGGAAVFLNGSTAVPVPPATVPAPGVRLQHRFEKTGRFLVICTNRFHAVNDYMFGFVNVIGDE